MANLECLRQLRRVVEAAPEDRFEMTIFSVSGKCGTAYCAAGWAAIDPWFREHTELGQVFRMCEDGTLNWGRNLELTPVLGRAFGLEEWDVDRLFGMFVNWVGEVTRQHVLANIDRLLAGEPARSYSEMLRESRRPRPPHHDAHNAPTASFGGGSPAS
jgi:hypothetical protein